MRPDSEIIEEYLSSSSERESDLRQVYEAVCAGVPDLTPFLFESSSMTMVSWGMYHYQYASGKQGDWPIIGLTNRKQYISLYVTCVAQDGRYLAEAYAERLGKVDVGKSCIRFKHAADLNLAEIKNIAHEAGEWLITQNNL